METKSWKGHTWKEYTPAEENVELRKMTDREVIAYNNILRMSATGIMSEESRAINSRHWMITEAIVEERGLREDDRRV